MRELLQELESVEGHHRQLAIHQRLPRDFPKKTLLFSDDGHFVVGSWAAATKDAKVSESDQFSIRKVHRNRDEVNWYLDQGFETVDWKGQRFEVFTVDQPKQHGAERWSWIIGTDEGAMRELFGVVTKWNTQVHGEVLVFGRGCFSKDAELQRAISATTFDELVLPGPMVTALRDDVKHFLASKALYAKTKAAWKRGMLLMGPPGNGKTHAIKALLNEAKLPVIYVKAFAGRYVDPAESIPQVFKRARELAPCAIVLEDLDSLVDDENRSYLLNELDGFAINDGLLTIASTNHPERLDPSLLHRPSRFDRKYRFDLPDPPLRRRYVEAWAKRNGLDLTDETSERVVELTNGFTFAYLKEAGLSTLMQLASEQTTRPLHEVLVGVIDQLKQEILATPAEGPAAPKARTVPRFPWDFG